MPLTLTPEIETALAEQARREDTTPERVALDGLQNLFVTPKHTPKETLDLAAQVYAGLSAQESRTWRRLYLWLINGVV